MREDVGRWLCNVFPISDPYWSNLTFGWWASWGAPNVPHFLTNYDSESRAASHNTRNNFLFPIKTHDKKSRLPSTSMFVFLSVSGPNCHKQWPLFEHNHYGGNEHLWHSASLFSIQGDSVQAGVCQKYNWNTLLWPFSSLVDWETVFLSKIWLNNMPLGGKSWDRAMAGVWLNTELERWIINPFSQSF